MDEEKKYSIVGRVEIGTDEYRDLIEKNASLQNENFSIRNQKWKLEDENRELQKRTSSQKELIENYKLFLSEKELTKDFDIWAYKKSIEQKNQEEE